MGAYVLHRLWQFVPTLFGVVLLVFVLFNWIGGDPAFILAGKISNPEHIENIRRQLGVDQPYYVQFWIFLTQIATGDFGVSWATNEKVSAIFATRIGPSLTVLVPMLMIGTLLAMAAAMIVSYLRGSLTDRAVMITCTAGQSVSILVYIIVLQYVLGYQLGWFPVQGWSQDFWLNLTRYSALPVIVGVVVSLAPDIRLYRTFFLDEINQDYVRTARAKGMGELRVMGVHVLRNAAIPIVTNVMIQLPALLAGAFLIERFFSIPGIGREVILAVERSDFPVIKAVTVYVAIATMVVNLAADLLYKAIDPRVQLEMSAGIATLNALDAAGSPGLWTLAWRRLRRDRVGMGSLVVVVVFVGLALASALGLVAGDWGRETGVNHAPPTFIGPDRMETSTAMPEAAMRDARADDTGIEDPLEVELAEIRRQIAGASPSEARAPTLFFGGDKWGRDVLKKTIKGTETSLLVGLAAALLAAFLGTVFGAYAGYFGGRIDDFFNWLFSVFTSIPYLLLILAIAAVLGQKGTAAVVLILGLTGWTGIFRLVRAEYLKHKVREYVQAADAIGASDVSRMFVHILPNVSHVVLVQMSLHVVLFIKSEVILSFLGFGVGVDTVSWGSMLNEAQNELLIGKWWQLAAASAAMAVLVTAFSLFTDALRDALDPRLK